MEDPHKGEPLVTYLIPVFNQERTIGSAVASAIDCAEQVDGLVVVSVNACTDRTLERVQAIKSARLKIITAPEYLSASDNLAAGLAAVQTSYTVMNGGDDLLAVSGQIVMAGICREHGARGVYFGDWVGIDGVGRVVNRNSMRFHWSSSTKARAMENVLKIRYPNINGVWIPTALFREGVEFSNACMTKDVVSYAGDACVWWHLSKTASFHHVPVNQVWYRFSDVSTPSALYQKGRRTKALIALLQFYENAVRAPLPADGLRSARVRAVTARRVRSLLAEVGLLRPDDRDEVVSRIGSALRAMPTIRLMLFASHRLPSTFRLVCVVLNALKWAQGRGRSVAKRLLRSAGGQADAKTAAESESAQKYYEGVAERGSVSLETCE